MSLQDGIKISNSTITKLFHFSENREKTLLLTHTFETLLKKRELGVYVHCEIKIENFGFGNKEHTYEWKSEKVLLADFKSTSPKLDFF